ncbi:MAG TPA: diaminopimelate decarboxylase [Microbacterium sp.]|nr:diaminopimelate decarboxylase [Microbacterium sp.]
MSAPASRPASPPVPEDIAALDPAVWPASARRDDRGVLQLGGVDATDLAARFGTPLYVLDETEVREHARRTVAAFRTAAARHGALARIYYAGKAFLSTEVVRWVTAEGMSVDVCSGGELEIALAAGMEPAHIGFHGNNKSVRELERAVEVGVGTIVLDSVIELERLAAIVQRHGYTQDVLLRVRSGVHAETHEFLATAHEDQKFGVAMEDAPAVVARIREIDGLRFLGLHCHIGSQIFGVAGFAESASRLVDLHAELLEGGPVPLLNLGGGFGIAYTSADDPTPIEDLAAGIANAVAQECEVRGIHVPELAVEPGRIIVGQAGVTLYEVGTVKPVQLDGGEATRVYVSVDGGMSDNARPALYGAEYTVTLASRDSDDEPVLVRVVGKHCESGDIVVDRGHLPADIAPGDLVAVPATGAYCCSLASNYNYVTRPAVVAVADGAARVIVRGETLADLLCRDAGIPSEGT